MTGWGRGGGWGAGGGCEGLSFVVDPVHRQDNTAHTIRDEGHI